MLSTTLSNVILSLTLTRWTICAVTTLSAPGVTLEIDLSPSLVSTVTSTTSVTAPALSTTTVDITVMTMSGLTSEVGTGTAPGSAVATSMQTSTVTTTGSTGDSMTTSVVTPPSTTATSSMSPGTTHVVLVGSQNALVFTPNTLSAAVGDSVSFVFEGYNHSVVESTLSSPCVSRVAGFSTGFDQCVRDGSTATVSFTVNSADPRFFYCSQSWPISHCGVGMVFALNAGGQYNRFAENVLQQGLFSTLVPGSMTESITVTLNGQTFVTATTGIALPSITLGQGTITIPTFTTSTVQV